MEVSLKVITIGDFPLLQILLERCSDYLTFQDEEAVKPSAAQDLFNIKPDGVKVDDKVLLSIVSDQKQLVGVFDLLKGYPDPTTLNLGLMLLEPSSRGKGIGTKAYKVLEEWIVSRQFNKVRLGVLFGNEKGLSFWRKMGYIETGEVKPYLSNKFMVLEKKFGARDVR